MQFASEQGEDGGPNAIWQAVQTRYGLRMSLCNPSKRDFRLVQVQKGNATELLRLEQNQFPEDEAGSMEGISKRLAEQNDFFKGIEIEENVETAVESLIEENVETSDTSGQGGRQAGPKRLIGLINGTLCDVKDGEQLQHECMEKHIPLGNCLVIHSVVVDKEYRGRGIAQTMVKEYCREVFGLTDRDVGDGDANKEIPNRMFDTIKLICKEHLIRLYEKTGFKLVGPSIIVHGKDPWFEMVMKKGDVC